MLETVEACKLMIKTSRLFLHTHTYTQSINFGPVNAFINRLRRRITSVVPQSSQQHTQLQLQTSKSMDGTYFLCLSIHISLFFVPNLLEYPFPFIQVGGVSPALASHSSCGLFFYVYVCLIGFFSLFLLCLRMCVEIDRECMFACVCVYVLVLSVCISLFRSPVSNFYSATILSGPQSPRHLQRIDNGR